MNFLDFQYSNEQANLTTAILNSAYCSPQNGYLPSPSIGYSNAIVRTTSQENRLPKVLVTEFAQNSLMRSESNSDLQNTKITFLSKKGEILEKLKPFSEINQNSEDQLQEIADQVSSSEGEFYQEINKSLPQKKSHFIIKSGREVCYSKRAPSTGLYNCIAPFFEIHGYVGVFLPQNRDILHAKDFESRTFKAVCFTEANHPIAHLSSMLEKMIRGIMWQNGRYPHDEYQIEEVTTQKPRVIPTRIREVIVIQYDEKNHASKWVGAVKQFDHQSEYSSRNFALLVEQDHLSKEMTSTFKSADIPFQRERLNTAIHSKREKDLRVEHTLKEDDLSPGISIDDDQIGLTTILTKKEEESHLPLTPSPMDLVCEPIDDDLINHSLKPSEDEQIHRLANFLQGPGTTPLSTINMSPDQRVVLKNQMTQDDTHRLTSMSTLPKNLTFESKSGREFYNSKVTISGLYNYFSPLFEQLGFMGIYVAERSEEFYNEDYEGRVFTAVYFKENKSIVNTTSTLNEMMKKISWRTCIEPILSYQTAEKSFKSDKNITTRKKIDEVVASMHERWGFVSFSVGDVKEYDPTSEYHTYILLFNKEKR